MVFPTLTQEQQKAIAQLQTVTKLIKGEIHSGDGIVTFKLLADDDKAKAAIPQVQKAIINSIASTLYTFFGVEGKIV